MTVQRGFPILITRDLERLEAFYLAAFGGTRSFAFQDGDRDVYVSLELDGATIGIGLDPDLDGPPRGVSLWLYVDDVDEAHRAALAAGATSEAEPTDMPWGERVARVRDPDGFAIDLGAEGP